VSHETLFYYIYFVNTQIRKSHTELNKIYFRTATIHRWLPLLEPGHGVYVDDDREEI
jgi:hypothetical protein